MKMKKLVAPGDLAAELAASEDRCTIAIEVARSKHRDVRKSVIDRGTARVAQLNALKAEIEAEAHALRALLAAA